jgi:hypothetical protein
MAKRLSVAALCVLLALAFGMTRFGFSVAEATQPTPATPEVTQPPAPNMHHMMKMHEQMMAEMNAGNAKLDALVKEMNAVSGEAKIAAMAVVITELVQQHTAMHGHMGQMHHHMMAGCSTMMHR